MATSIELESDIRKLRKKLRQIENLERLERPLNDEEISKVVKKSNLRNTLQDLLSQITVSPPRPAHEEDDQKQSQESIAQTAEGSSTADNTSAADDDDTMKRDIKKTEREVDVSDERRQDDDDDETIPAKIARTDQKSSQQKAPQTTKEKKTKRQSSLTSMMETQNYWRSSQFVVRTLEGHNDIICCVDCDEVLIVTGSRDTTVKVWDGDTGVELCSLGGHTATVTTIRLLSKAESQRVDILTEDLEDDENSRIAVSGSLDCSLKVWNITEGHLLKSFYAYNPLQCLVYLPDDVSVVTGSDGGKLELWDMVKGESLHSVISDDGAVTDMKVYKTNEDTQYIVTGFEAGTIKVWTTRNQQLSLLFVSDDIKSSSSQLITLRKIHCLATFQDMIYYGDNGVNIKVLHWKTANLHKLRNHLCEFGSTDAVCIGNGIMVSSGYNLDHGLGYLNVWSIPGEHYLGTLNDQKTNKIFATACTKTRQDSQRIVSVGDEIKVWDQTKSSSRNPNSVGVDFNWSYTIKAEDSDNESDQDLTDDDNEDRIQTRQRFPSTSSQDSQSNRGWMSWCAII